jgi:hypothetical protein
MNTDDINHELILGFYSDFCRFESALRKAGYFKDRHPSQADWDRFIGVVEAHFDPNTESERMGAYITLLDYAYEHGRDLRIKGAIREIILASETIQKMGNDLTRGTILRRYTETEITSIYAATLILSAWAELEPNVKRIWNTPTPAR